MLGDNSLGFMMDMDLEACRGFSVRSIFLVWYIELGIALEIGLGIGPGMGGGSAGWSWSSFAVAFCG